MQLQGFTRPRIEKSKVFLLFPKITAGKNTLFRTYVIPVRR